MMMALVMFQGICAMHMPSVIHFMKAHSLGSRLALLMHTITMRVTRVKS